MGVRSSKFVAFVCMMLLLVSPNIGADAFISTAFSGVRNQANCYRAAAISPAESGISEKKGSIGSHIGSRRDALLKQGALIFGIFSGTDLVNALDIEAFMNSEIEKDSKSCNPKVDPKCQPKLSQDEALCKYGQSGPARGEACQRVKEKGGNLPGKTKEKSLGGAYAM